MWSIVRREARDAVAHRARRRACRTPRSADRRAGSRNARNVCCGLRTEVPATDTPTMRQPVDLVEELTNRCRCGHVEGARVLVDRSRRNAPWKEVVTNLIVPTINALDEVGSAARNASAPRPAMHVLQEVVTSMIDEQPHGHIKGYALVVCPPTEAHLLSALVGASLLVDRGWATSVAGRRFGDSDAAITRMAEEVDRVVVCASSWRSLVSARDLVDLISPSARFGLRRLRSMPKVIAAGSAFSSPERAQAIGAIGTTSDGESLVFTGHRPRPRRSPEPVPADVVHELTGVVLDSVVERRPSLWQASDEHVADLTSMTNELIIATSVSREARISDVVPEHVRWMIERQHSADRDATLIASIVRTTAVALVQAGYSDHAATIEHHAPARTHAAGGNDCAVAS
jgi:hypothetical protein